VSNPFDKQDGQFFVLVNENGQYSLWPAFIKIPDGWRNCVEGDRQYCLDYIKENWIDMQPKIMAE
jgi:MbtH protein